MNEEKEVHNHYHINLLPQDPFAWVAISFGCVFTALAIFGGG